MSKQKHFHKAPIQAPEDPLAKYEPYLRPVLLGVGAVVVLLLGVYFFRSRVDSRVSNQWREFSSAYYETALNGAPDSMSQFSERFPGTPAGLAAEQIAGDILLRNGLSKQIVDDAAAKKDIEAARKRFQKVIENSPQKTGLMYERSVYSLAYALEALRNCDEAIVHYTALTKNPKSTFAELAQRGVDRCKLALSVGFFTALDKIEEAVSGPAPGEGFPERPDISYPPSADTEASSQEKSSSSEEPKSSDAPPAPPGESPSAPPADGNTSSGG